MSRHLEHIKCPDHLGHKQSRLHPCHFLASANSWAETEGKEALEIIFSKLSVIKRMGGWEPALWPVLEWVVEVALASGEGEDAGLDSGLEG